MEYIQAPDAQQRLARCYDIILRAREKSRPLRRSKGEAGEDKNA